MKEEEYFFEILYSHNLTSKIYTTYVFGK